MSERLLRLRAEIDAVDAQLLELLNRRAAIVLDVQQVKARAEMSRVDNPRMQQILDQLVALNRGPLTSEEVRDVYGELLQFFAHRLEPR